MQACRRARFYPGVSGGRRDSILGDSPQSQAMVLVTSPLRPWHSEQCRNQVCQYQGGQDGHSESWDGGRTSGGEGRCDLGGDRRWLGSNWPVTVMDLSLSPLIPNTRSMRALEHLHSQLSVVLGSVPWDQLGRRGLASHVHVPMVLPGLVQGSGR